MGKVHPLIVTAVAVALALTVSVLNYFYPFAELSAAYYAYLAISPVWAFCVVPSYFYGCYLFAKSSENLSTEENMRRGARLGVLYGFGLVLLPLLIAPVFAVMYYVTVIKNKKNRKKQEEDDRIFKG